MNSKERMIAARSGARVDRVPFSPTIFEHSARLIGKTPSETATNGYLLEEAHIRAFETYGHDLVTVGIDVYNIEAEALGCKIKYHDDSSIPGVVSHPWGVSMDMEDIGFDIDKGRIGMVLDAASRVNLRIGSRVNVTVGICGPFSIAVELVGYENIIYACVCGNEKINELLKRILCFQKRYCDEIINRKIGVTIFESWATPPLVSPDMYREFILPVETELISYIKNKGITFVPLVIGGNTTSIVDDIIESGTSILVADYMVDIGMYVEKASKKGLMIRGNIDPKLVESGTNEEIIKCIREVLIRVNGYSRFVLGTGVITYNTHQHKIQNITEYLNDCVSEK